MGAFVSGSTFQHDVFVSYAHADNPAFGQDKGWVELLVEQLRELLPQKLKRGQPDIWFDRRLPGNEPFPEQIREAVTQSATLLVILSENYLASEWCQTELALFLDAADHTGGAAGRIFLVRVDELPPEGRPDTLQTLLGYEFYERDEDRQRIRILGSPIADDPDRKLFFQQLDDLRCDLAGQLLRMKEAVEVQGAQNSGSAGDQPAIFLAEVTPDLEDARDKLRRHLKQLGVRVLPETLYDRSPDAYEKAASADLDQSLVFVQLLGPYASLPAPGLPNGYEGLQLDIAEHTGIPILRWHSPGLDPASFRDQELLKRAGVMVMAFEEFKREIVNAAHQQSMKAKWSEQKTDDAFILVKANSPRQQDLNDIQVLLNRENMFYDTADKDESIELLVETYGFHGLMIVYDRVEAQWAKQQLRACRELMLKKGKQALVICVVYTVPPNEEPNLGIRLPNVRHLSHRNHADLSKFFTEVQAKVAAL